MGLLSIFRSRADAGAAGTGDVEPIDGVQRARTRARQRLIGAVVLVVTGVVGFPLVFETQPRPVSVDVPIEIPRKEGAPALVMPPARLPTLPTLPTSSVKPGAAGDVGAIGAAASTPIARASQPSGAALSSVPVIVAPVRDHDAVITESREESGHAAGVTGFPSVAPMAGSAPPAAASHRVASAPVVPKPAEPAVAAAAKPTPPGHAVLSDGARAKALLEGTDHAPVSAMRFVVQIGAFADAGAARETRSKVDKLGLKTYTQTAQTPAGPRIRVRVGPFATRDDAIKAQGRARSAGLAAVVLVL